MNKLTENILNYSVLFIVIFALDSVFFCFHRSHLILFIHKYFLKIKLIYGKISYPTIIENILYVFLIMDLLVIISIN
jgi:hypothetical protein